MHVWPFGLRTFPRAQRKCTRRRVTGSLSHHTITTHSSEPKNEEEDDPNEDGSTFTSTGLNCALSGVRPDFELGGVADLESIFLQGMLSEKELDGFSCDRKTPGQPVIAGDDSEAPTDDDWKNL